MNDKERQERDKENRQFLLKFDLARETLDGAITEADIDAEICRRLQDGVDDEYLVNGALLTCTKAKWGDFEISEDEVIKIEKLSEKLMSGEPTEYLRVLENPLHTNNLRHANVTDTKKEWNIMPFPCNCSEPASDEQKELIRANKVDCQNHGVCKYLMDLEEEWENIDFNVPYAEFPDEKMTPALESIQASTMLNKPAKKYKKGITMTSVLFCKHGGFIYPLTSGQTILFNQWETFASENCFTARQCMALLEIMNYFENNPELRQGTSIFVFEGLATPVPLKDESLKDKNDPHYEWNWNGTNKYHPNGQFGAIIIVTVNGKPDCAAMKASTLSDNMEKATICEGVYEVSNTAHSRNTDGGYAALTLNNDLNIPAYNSKTGNDYANLIHFHMAGPLYPGSAYSEGCITMPVREYVAFGKQVGFIDEGADDKGENNSYSEARTGIKASSHSKEFNGYMVIDRQYFDDVGNQEGDKYLKFNGPRGQE